MEDSMHTLRNIANESYGSELDKGHPAVFQYVRKPTKPVVFTVSPSLSGEPGGYGDETKCAETSQHEDEDRDKLVLS
jgi:hypothetical protein